MAVPPRSWLDTNCFLLLQGIQSLGVIANAKHFILNNEETNRYNVSDNADERTMWEIYLTPFQAAVDAGVLSVMCSCRVGTGELWRC